MKIKSMDNRKDLTLAQMKGQFNQEDAKKLQGSWKKAEEIRIQDAEAKKMMRSEPKKERAL